MYFDSFDHTTTLYQIITNSSKINCYTNEEYIILVQANNPNPKSINKNEVNVIIEKKDNLNINNNSNSSQEIEDNPNAPISKDNYNQQNQKSSTEDNYKLKLGNAEYKCSEIIGKTVNVSKAYFEMDLNLLKLVYSLVFATVVIAVEAQALLHIVCLNGQSEGVLVQMGLAYISLSMLLTAVYYTIDHYGRIRLIRHISLALLVLLILSTSLLLLNYNNTLSPNTSAQASSHTPDSNTPSNEQPYSSAVFSSVNSNAILAVSLVIVVLGQMLLEILYIYTFELVGSSMYNQYNYGWHLSMYLGVLIMLLLFNLLHGYFNPVSADQAEAADNHSHLIAMSVLTTSMLAVFVALNYWQPESFLYNYYSDDLAACCEILDSSSNLAHAGSSLPHNGRIPEHSSSDNRTDRTDRTEDVRVEWKYFSNLSLMNHFDIVLSSRGKYYYANHIFNSEREANEYYLQKTDDPMNYYVRSDMKVIFLNKDKINYNFKTKLLYYFGVNDALRKVNFTILNALINCTNLAFVITYIYISFRLHAGILVAPDPAQTPTESATGANPNELSPFIAVSSSMNTLIASTAIAYTLYVMYYFLIVYANSNLTNKYLYNLAVNSVSSFVVVWVLVDCSTQVVSAQLEALGISGSVSVHAVVLPWLLFAYSVNTCESRMMGYESCECKNRGLMLMVVNMIWICMLIVYAMLYILLSHSLIYLLGITSMLTLLLSSFRYMIFKNEFNRNI